MKKKKSKDKNKEQQQIYEHEHEYNQEQEQHHHFICTSLHAHGQSALADSGLREETVQSAVNVGSHANGFVLQQISEDICKEVSVTDFFKKKNR